MMRTSQHYANLRLNRTTVCNIGAKNKVFPRHPLTCANGRGASVSIVHLLFIYSFYFVYCLFVCIMYLIRFSFDCLKKQQQQQHKYILRGETSRNIILLLLLYIHLQVIKETLYL